ncbi:hypothetical protein AB0M11_13625 [Streptomyces sp. NPDC051987]|uniref:hypothetical protein n=1 Tax=Streptomyces sp. NPDC051987 TaxID=3155808 RepID=UPI0034415C82
MTVSPGRSSGRSAEVRTPRSDRGLPGRNVRDENWRNGLRVLALSPGAAQTEFFDVAGQEAASGVRRLQTPREVVATALNTLDRRNPPPSIAVGRTNRAMLALTGLVGRRRSVMFMGALTDRAAGAA